MAQGQIPFRSLAVEAVKGFLAPATLLAVPPLVAAGEALLTLHRALVYRADMTPSLALLFTVVAAAPMTAFFAERRRGWRTVVRFSARAAVVTLLAGAPLACAAVWTDAGLTARLAGAVALWMLSAMIAAATNGLGEALSARGWLRALVDRRGDLALLFVALVGGVGAFLLLYMPVTAALLMSIGQGAPGAVVPADVAGYLAAASAAPVLLGRLAEAYARAAAPAAPIVRLSAAPVAELRRAA